MAAAAGHRLQQRVPGHAEFDRITRLQQRQLDTPGTALRVRGRRDFAHLGGELLAGQSRKGNRGVLARLDARQVALGGIQIQIGIAAPGQAVNALPGRHHRAGVGVFAGDYPIVIGHQGVVLQIVLRQQQLGGG